MLQRNFLDVAAPGFTRPAEVIGAGIPDAEWRASGYGSADAFAWARPVEAVYAGAGHLRLPIEAALDAPPAPLGTGDASAPLFTCNASWADPLDEGGAGTGEAGAWATDWTHAGEPLVSSDSVSVGQALFVLSGCNASQGGAGDDSGCAGRPLSYPPGSPGNRSGSSASRGSPLSRTAFASYAYCMAACNREVLAPVWARGWAAANASGGRVAPWQAADDWCSASASSSQSRYPFYVAAAGGVGVGATPAYSPPAPSVACWLPSPCAALSSVSRRDQRARVSGAYGRYVDVLMSEALRGGASLSVDTPLTVTTLPRDPVSGFTLQRSYLAKARVMASKMPNFFFSSYVRVLWGMGHP